MMKRFLTLIVLLIPSSFLLTGCGLVSLNTNIPSTIIGSANTMEVVNSSSHDLTFTVNGSPLTFDFGKGKTNRLKRGQSMSFRYLRTFAITAKAWNGNHLSGVAVYKRHAYNYSGYSYYGYNRDANVWVVYDNQISQQSQHGFGSGVLGW